MSFIDGAMASAVGGMFPSSEVRALGMLLSHQRESQNVEVAKVKSLAKAARKSAKAKVKAKAASGYVRSLQRQVDECPPTSKEFKAAQKELRDLGL